MHKFTDITKERLILLRESGFIPSKIADIGANVGQFYSLIKEVYPDSNVLSIEGNPSCEIDLKSTNPNYLISLLGSEEEEKILYVNKDYDKCTGSSIYKETTDFYLDCNEITVKSKTLDSLNMNFDLIKIDVQGSELDILKGGIKTIVDCEYLLVELSVKNYNQGSSSADEVIIFLSNLGFKIYDIFSHFYFNDKLTQIDFLFLNSRKNSDKFEIK